MTTTDEALEWFGTQRFAFISREQDCWGAFCDAPSRDGSEQLPYGGRGEKPLDAINALRQNVESFNAEVVDHQNGDQPCEDS